MAEENTERDDEIFALAQSGVPHSAIASKYGISRARVGQVVSAKTPAVWGFTEKDKAQVRAKELAVLDRLTKKVEAVVNDPPLVHSAIGKTVEDPRNPGRYLINEAVRVAAARELRLLSESRRRLLGADLGASDRTMGRDEATKAMLAAIDAERARRDAQLADLAAAGVPYPPLTVIQSKAIS